MGARCRGRGARALKRDDEDGLWAAIGHKVIGEVGHVESFTRSGVAIGLHFNER
jgi:hypothetical protein